MPEIVKIEGLAELARALQELPRNIGRNVLRGAVRASAAMIKNETKLRAPVETGQLKRAIYEKHIREESDLYRQTFKVGVRSGKKYQAGQGKRTAKTAMDAYYAPWVEFGHHARGKKGGERGRWVPGRPFMRPAWDANRRRAVDVMADYLRKRLPAEVAKARGGR